MDSEVTNLAQVKAFAAADYATAAQGTKANAAAPLASPTFTGVPAGPTAAVATDTTQLATTAFVLANAPSPSTTAGAVGTYVYGTTVNSTTAQPQFIYEAANDFGVKDEAVSALSGTWRCMGQGPGGVFDEMPVNLFLRIS